MAKVFPLDFAIGMLPALAALAGPPTAWAQPVELGDPPLFPAYPPAALSPRASASAAVSGLSVNASQREAVRNFYNALFAASNNVDMGWTGSISGCASGSTAQTFRDAVALRVNVLRALAGVPAAVTFNDTYNGKAQQAALMMSANNQLDHFPPSSWACYTAVGGEAAGKSNLSLGLAGADAVTFGQLKDDGDNNAVVGHRRWLLYPQTQEMGSGDVAGDDSHRPANVLWVQDSHILDARPAVRDGFVAWPPPGFVPYPLAFARWSLSYPDADFSAATVSMSRAGVAVPVTLETVTNGYGENTLVWRPSDALLANTALLAGADDASFTVSLRNMRLGGKAQGIDYTVTLFDPLRYGTDTLLPQVTGSASPTSGQDNSYRIAGAVPMADSYDWFYAKAAVYATVLGAENGLAGMVAAISPGYAATTNETAAAGSNAYHLEHAQPATQILSVDANLLPGANGALIFQSRLGWASSNEVAAVQASVDGGSNWQDVASQAGNNGKGETAFTLRRLPLAAFAGRAIKLRFVYQKPQGAYYATGPGVGWYLDEVAFEDTAILDAPTVKTAAGGSFTFTPPTSGLFALAARGSLRGHPLEWGGINLVSAGGASPTECLFAWAEKNYPSLFSPAAATANWSVYTYRYYSATQMYLGVSSADSHVYYIGADGILRDAGPSSYWLPLAGC